MKNICAIISIFISISCFGSFPSSIEKSLKAKIKAKIGNISCGLEKMYGIENGFLIDSLEIQNSFDIYMFNVADSSLTLSNKKLYPILLMNKIIFFAKGVEIDNEIKLFGLGGNVFAENIEKVKNKSKQKEIALLCLPLQNTYLLIDILNLKEKQQMNFFAIKEIEECASCPFSLKESFTYNEILSIIKTVNSKTNLQDENITN